MLRSWSTLDQRWTRRVVVALLLPGGVTTPSIHRPVDVRDVPLSRLSANLQRAILYEPRNPLWVHNLARAHAMAWSRRSVLLPVFAGASMPGLPPLAKVEGRTRAESVRLAIADRVANEARDVWVGGAAMVPFTRVAEVTDSTRLRVARAHFDTALTLYAQAVALDSNDMVIRLGQAWLLSQTPDRALAVRRLRAIVRIASAPPVDPRMARSHGGAPLANEAARYLIPLLDRTKDRKEIARLEAKIREEQERPRAVTPIAIPLADVRSAAALEAASASVPFDADGSGIPKQWTWIRPNAAWLVHDPQRTGRVTSALQLFGSVTFWMFWNNGYEALASLDDDRDGALRGHELDGLALWNDANSNGISERGEVRTLAAYDIVALNCRATRDPDHPDRIYRAVVGVTYRDGTTRSTYDLVLHERGAKPTATLRTGFSSTTP